MPDGSAPNTLYPDIPKEGQSHAKEGHSLQHSVPGYCRGRSVTEPPTLCNRMLPRKVSHPNALYPDIAKEGQSQCPQHSVPGCCQGRSVTPTLVLYPDIAKEGQSPQHSVPGYSQGRSVTPTLCTWMLPRKVSHPNTMYLDVAKEGQPHAKEGQSPQHSLPGYCQGRSVTVPPTLCTRILPRKVRHPNTRSVPGYCRGRSVTPTLCTRIFPRKVSHPNTLYPDIAQ